MRKLLFVVSVSFLLVSCHATARFYPVQGPLASQTPPPVLVGRVSGAFYSGSMTVKGIQGQVFRGRWEAVKRPNTSTTTPPSPPTDNEMAPLWDSIYGNGFYVAHVLGMRLYGRGSLTGNGGSTLKVEFYRPQEGDGSAGNSGAGSVKGVAKDDQGNVYKVTFF